MWSIVIHLFKAPTSIFFWKPVPPIDVIKIVIRAKRYFALPPFNAIPFEFELKGILFHSKSFISTASLIALILIFSSSIKAT